MGSMGLSLPSGMLSGVGVTELPQRADFYPFPSSRDLKLHLPSPGSRLAPASSPLFMEQWSRCQTWGLGGTGALPVKPVSPVQCHPAPLHAHCPNTPVLCPCILGCGLEGADASLEQEVLGPSCADWIRARARRVPREPSTGGVAGAVPRPRWAGRWQPQLAAGPRAGSVQVRGSLGECGTASPSAFSLFFSP